MFGRRRSRDLEPAALVVYGHGREVELTDIHFAEGAVESIRKWLSGRMSGKKCRRNVLKACVSSCAGIAGATAGMAVGATAGMAFGGVAGPAVGSVVGYVTRATCKYLLKKIFGFHRDEAVVNAFHYFGFHRNSTNEEIRHEYRTRCLRLHPDKGGDAEEFQLMQMHYAIIKAARSL